MSRQGHGLIAAAAGRLVALGLVALGPVALGVALALPVASASAQAQAPAPSRPELTPMARTAGPAAPQMRPARLNLLVSPAPAGGAPSASETRQLVIGAPRPVPAGALLGSDEQPLAPDGAYSVVLADRSARTVALCQAMTQALAFTDPARATSRPQVLRPIYWLLASSGAQVGAMGELSCDSLVGNIDLLRAGAAALDGHQGPKLRAIMLRGDAAVVDVLWDLSGQPDSEFRRAVGLWADLLTDDPARWEGRVRQMQLIEDFRGFLIHVGDPLSNLLGVRAAAGSAPTHVIRITR
jgi:hypothetical protein